MTTCFNDLFPNTKHDEGQCSKRHDAYLKRLFEDDTDSNKAQYEKRYVNNAISNYNYLIH